jgi:hypothetical protein
MNHCSLFSLFLSTTGKIMQFTSLKDKDISGHFVAGMLLLIAPYTDLGFDQLAKKIAHDGNFTLADITSDKPSMGVRCTFITVPSFNYFSYRCGARFDFSSSEIKDTIIQFGGVPYTHQPLNNHKTLAFLAQRLPIEFHSTTYFEQSQEMEQIEGHLRVCLKIDAGFESIPLGFNLLLRP